MLLRSLLLFMVLLFSVQSSLTGQDPIQFSSDTGCVEKDLKNLVSEALHKPRKEQKQRSGSVLVVPIVGSNPAIGFMAGVG